LVDVVRLEALVGRALRRPTVLDRPEASCLRAAVLGAALGDAAGSPTNES